MYKGHSVLVTPVYSTILLNFFSYISYGKVVFIDIFVLIILLKNIIILEKKTYLTCAIYSS